jgi:hypothetical protein
MEYRKKNLKPKKNIDNIIQDAVTNEAFMSKLEFFGLLRKDIYIN